MPRQFNIKTNIKQYDLEARVQLIGKDLLVAILGGDTPHIGAVAAAHPRPSLEDPSVTSATASVICFSGHKEDAIAKSVSEALASAYNTRVVVTAGIHWDDIDKYGIQKVNQNSKILVDQILCKIDKIRFAPP